MNVTVIYATNDKMEYFLHVQEVESLEITQEAIKILEKGHSETIKKEKISSMFVTNGEDMYCPMVYANLDREVSIVTGKENWVTRNFTDEAISKTSSGYRFCHGIDFPLNK